MKTKNPVLKLIAATATASLFVMANAANAVSLTTNDFQFVETFPGNDCAGELGTPPNCSWNGSPMIAKFDFQDDGTIKFTKGAFASISGGEFAFSVANEVKDGKYSWASSGSWTYTPGADDPGITAFSVKGGPNFSVYDKVGQAFLGVGDFSNTWSVPEGKGLSHIVFYDSVAPVPLPAAAWLFISALGGLALVGRRRRALATA